MLALAIVPTFLVAVAQSPAATTPSPLAVPKGTTVRVDGSSSMATINQTLKKYYEKEFAGTQVTIAETGSTEAIQALLKGDVDLAAIGRPLTAEETAKGLIATPIKREKIAILVGSGNSFKGNLTFEQFAKIFRGEITNWSEVGGTPGAIRFVDRPETSDTRQAFRSYPVFQTAPFKVGATAKPVAQDNTTNVIQALGSDGIGYAIANQVLDRKDVKIVPMHKTLPTDPRYPFSQPLNYVYQGTPTPAVRNFLGFVTAPVGQQAVEEARAVEAAAIASGSAPKASATTSPETTTGATTSPNPASTPNDSASVPPPANSVATTAANKAIPAWIWLLPLALLGFLLWGWLKRRSQPDGVVPTDSPIPPADPTIAEIPPSSALGLENGKAPATIHSETGATNVASDLTGGIPGAGAIVGGAAGATAWTAMSNDSPASTSSSDSTLVESAKIVEPLTPLEQAAEATPVASDVESAASDHANPVEGATAGWGFPAEATIVGGAGLATGAGAVAWSALSEDHTQSDVEAAKFDVGQTDLSSESLATVDEGLPDLPSGYGETRIVLMPRDPQWAYAYWDVPNEHREELRRQGGQRLAVRLYDVTDIDLNHQQPHSLQQYECEEMTRNWYLPIPISDRDYVAEIGYIAADGRWLKLARSVSVRVPPVYPSDWFEDQFITLSSDEDLRGKAFLELIPPSQRSATPASNPIYDNIFGMAQSAEIQRVAGSLFGSMQQLPQVAINAAFPSGMGSWAVPMSGLNMSGVGMSGGGFPASSPIHPRKFWLVADAELIVHGATEPDATVTIGDQTVQLSPDGTFRFHLSFQDGAIDYPIQAVAADGEQTRSVHMEFNRETPERRTNTQDEATDEWL